MGLLEVNAQYGNITEGKCGEEVRWRFDGYTLTISNVNRLSQHGVECPCLSIWVVQ